MKRPRNNKGFTLIELVFEITVLSLLIIPTVLLLGQLSLTVVQTEANSIATALCVQKAEEVLWSYDYSTVSASSGNFNAPYSDYSYTVTIDYVDAANPAATVASSNYKRATVTVSHSSIPDVVTYLLFVNL